MQDRQVLKILISKVNIGDSEEFSENSTDANSLNDNNDDNSIPAIYKSQDVTLLSQISRKAS